MRYLKTLDIKLVRGNYKNPVTGQVRNPKQMYDAFNGIKNKAQETLIGVYLNDALEVSAYDILSIGTKSETLFSPAEIFGRAFVMMSKLLAI